MSLRTIVGALLALGAMAGPAWAEPTKLTDAQMDGVAGGIVYSVTVVTVANHSVAANANVLQHSTSTVVNHSVPTVINHSIPAAR